MADKADDADNDAGTSMHDLLYRDLACPRLPSTTKLYANPLFSEVGNQPADFLTESV